MGAGLTRDGPAQSEDRLSRLAGLNLCTPWKVETPTEEVLILIFWPFLRNSLNTSWRIDTR